MLTIFLRNRLSCLSKYFLLCKPYRCFRCQMPFFIPDLLIRENIQALKDIFTTPSVPENAFSARAIVRFSVILRRSASRGSSVWTQNSLLRIPASNSYNRRYAPFLLLCCSCFLVPVCIAACAPKVPPSIYPAPKWTCMSSAATVTLPISEAPNLLPGDRLWIHPDLPQTPVRALCAGGRLPARIHQSAAAGVVHPR